MVCMTQYNISCWKLYHESGSNKDKVSKELIGNLKFDTQILFDKCLLK